MLIVFDSKSSLTHYTFDKIKFLSQLHICIALLNILFLKIYVQKLTCCSWKLGFRGIIFSARKLRECRILHHLPQSFWGPCRKATSARWGRVTLWPSTRLLNSSEYTSFWGSYAPVHRNDTVGQVNPEDGIRMAIGKSILHSPTIVLSFEVIH